MTGRHAATTQNRVRSRRLRDLPYILRAQVPEQRWTPTRAPAHRYDPKHATSDTPTTVDETW